MHSYLDFVHYRVLNSRSQWPILCAFLSMETRNVEKRQVERLELKLLLMMLIRSGTNPAFAAELPRCNQIRQAWLDIFELGIVSSLNMN